MNFFKNYNPMPTRHMDIKKHGTDFIQSALTSNFSQDPQRIKAVDSFNNIVHFR